MRSALYTRKRGAWVSWLSIKTKIDGLSVVWPQNHWDGLSVVWPQNHWDSFFWFGIKTCGFGFFDLGLKTSSYGLMIWASKLSQRFLDLGLKIKWATIYQLHHKTDRRVKTMRVMYRDLTAYFGWKQVVLGFFSLSSRLAETWRGWYTWHHHEGHV
jgi:hypothetical protein